MNTNVGLLGKKVGMGYMYDEDGKRHAVTAIHSPDCVVAGIRTEEKDGYAALQLGVGSVKEKNATKPQKGQCKDLTHIPREICEFRVGKDVCDSYKVGDSVSVEIFDKGQFVDVAGKTIGKGFQGVMKRYGFGGFIATHGTHESFRGTGSVGARTWPGRIYKGRKMPGHMGAKRQSMLNLRVMAIDPKENVILVKGAVPGSKGSFVEVRKAVKK